jgi:hypothetical protein
MKPDKTAAKAKKQKKRDEKNARLLRIGKRLATNPPGGSVKAGSNP